MDSLTAAIQRCQLSLKLDNETEGQGNCFPNSIVQQCRIDLEKQKRDGVIDGVTE